MDEKQYIYYLEAMLFLLAIIGAIASITAIVAFILVW